MPFFLLIQEPVYTDDLTYSWPIARFVWIEAASPREAEQRALWFGCDMSEKVGNSYDRWRWHLSSCNTPQPRFGRYSIGEVRELYEDRNEPTSTTCAVVYQNNNIRCSGGTFLTEADI